jgi:hypothetical protein
MIAGTSSQSNTQSWNAGRKSVSSPDRFQSSVRHGGTRFANAPRADFDRLAIVGEQEVVRVDLDDAVGPDDLPIDAHRSDRAHEAALPKGKIAQIDHRLYRDVDLHQP